VGVGGTTLPSTCPLRFAAEPYCIRLSNKRQNCVQASSFAARPIRQTSSTSWIMSHLSIQFRSFGNNRIRDTSSWREYRRAPHIKGPEYVLNRLALRPRSSVRVAIDLLSPSGPEVARFSWPPCRGWNPCGLLQRYLAQVTASPCPSWSRIRAAECDCGTSGHIIRTPNFHPFPTLHPDGICNPHVRQHRH